jgi:DNA-binding MarR family transcriptional regulator
LKDSTVTPLSQSSSHPVDDLENIALIGNAWRDMRRGAAASSLRSKLFGEGESALDPGQVDTLDLLVEREFWRMGDLAEALRVDPSTATRAIQRLEKLQLAERATLASDGRVVTVAVTPAGRTRYNIITERRLKVMVKILSDFAPEDQAKLAELLTQFVTSIDNVASTFEP